MSKAGEYTWGKPANTRTVGDWIDEHGLESWILPLKTRKVNPLEIIQQVKTRLDEMPKTQSTLTFRNLGFDHLAEQYKFGIMRLFLLRECEHIENTRFLNPNYMHYGHTLDPVTDADERMAMFEQFQDSPFISSSWFGTHWGLTPKATRNFLLRRNIKIREVERENKARFGRTLQTLHKWGYEVQSIAETMPAKTETIAKWTSCFQENECYQPPSRPTDEPWYSTRMRTQEAKR